MDQVTANKHVGQIRAIQEFVDKVVSADPIVFQGRRGAFVVAITVKNVLDGKKTLYIDPLIQKWVRDNMPLQWVERHVETLSG